MFILIFTYISLSVFLFIVLYFYTIYSSVFKACDNLKIFMLKILITLF